MGNEHRKYTRALSLKFPRISGKKTINLKLFKASKWRAKHRLEESSFFPKVPMQTKARNEYFSCRFRVMVGDKWYMVGGHRYVMLTRAEAYQVLDELETD